MKAAPQIAGLGFRVHSGWAAAVAVAGPVKAPQVVLRKTIIIADPAIPGSKQPYHAAQKLGLKQAETLVRRCTASTRALARRAVRGIVAELRTKGLQPGGACILLSSGRELGPLAAILASHPRIHTAEGVFFREALRRACRRSRVTVTGVKEREITAHAAAALRLQAGTLRRRAAQMGRTLGPPWRQDEKLAALAAWLMLAGPKASKLRRPKSSR
ncbi:MAG TPA: hypothetical protein VE825_11085 [Terriglobales bacterium]|nr:hypothetical protein [Terriglobales bacterium]